MIVKNAAIERVVKKIIINIYPLQSIKNLQILQLISLTAQMLLYVIHVIKCISLVWVFGNINKNVKKY